MFQKGGGRTGGVPKLAPGGAAGGPRGIPGGPWLNAVRARGRDAKVQCRVDGENGEVHRVKEGFPSFRTSRVPNAASDASHLLLQHLAHLHLIRRRRAAVERPQFRFHQRLRGVLLELHVVVADVGLSQAGENEVSIKRKSLAVVRAMFLRTHFITSTSVPCACSPRCAASVQRAAHTTWNAFSRIRTE